MFDSAYASNSNGIFGSYTPFDSEDAGIFEAPRPRREFRQQKIGLYLLSNLFSSSFMGTSCFVKDQRLVNLERDKTVSFSGETFDQWDLDVLLHCVVRTIAIRDGVGKIQVDPAELLRDARLRNFEENQDQVYASLFRLHTGSLCIQGKGYRYMTRLIDRVLLDQSKGRCLVEVNSDVVNSLRCERDLRIAVQSRFGFKRSGLAKWLHGAIMVFKGGFKADMNSLHMLCGASNRSRYIFPKLVGKALAAMEESGLVGSWQIDGQRVMVLPRSREWPVAACGFIASGIL